MNNTLHRKRRGWIENSELTSYENNTVDELLSLFSSENAQARTIAAKLLPLDCETTNILLDSLVHEPALYTRLAITEKLESGDASTAKKMIPFLAVIGNNQHRFPIEPSKKKSFPLPRNLIARSLGRMQPEIFSVLLDAAKTLPAAKLSELIDALGYMAFYHPSLATNEAYQQLLVIRAAHDTEPLIQWKLLICFSAFPQSRELLRKETHFRGEARRSLKLIAQKTKPTS